MAEFKEILNKLGVVKKVGNGYQAHCPAHDDQKKSLSIGLGDDGRILLHCHAGCEPEAVVTALGYKMSDLFKGSEQCGHIITRVYNYHNRDGMLLFQVCRTADKSFFQRRPDGNSGFINGLGDVTPVLYRLPQLKEAVAEGKPIFITEGEKDADNLWGQGLAATTNPMGAGKWRDHFSDDLKGANVILLPDNDEPGRRHVQKIGESLKGKANSIKVLELPGLPEKGDVTDYLENGGTVKELLNLAAEAPVWDSGVKRSGKKEEKATEQSSFTIKGSTIFEQVYIDGKHLFLAYNIETGETEIVSSLEKEGIVITPLSGEEIALGAVKLPSGVNEYGDTLSLLAEIERHINKHLDVSPFYRKFAAYYVLLSWLSDRFYTIPYLRALGDTGCGKSRFLDVIGGLCYKAISASGCVTPAPIYRMLRKWLGTLILDEADMKNSDEYNEVITILNCGFEKGRPVIRATKDNPDQIQILPVYGPKVFATRRRFKDPALEARCLTEIMQETDRDDIPPVLSRSFFEEQQDLRNKLLLFRLRNYFAVEPEAAHLNLGEIEPRLKQISESFIALFANEPAVLKSYQVFIQAHQRELIEQRAATKVGQVVEVLFTLLDEKGVPSAPSVPSPKGLNDIGTGISAGDIAEKLDMTYQAVGAILKTLGLKTKQMRSDGEKKRQILYNEATFKKLRKRYILLEEEMPQTALTTSGVGADGTLGQMGENTDEDNHWEEF